MRRVYMDANATTPLLPEVMEAMRPYWMEHYGNASSIHQHGQRARTAVDQARETLAEFFGCHAAEVVFTSGGTEGDNTALFGLLHPGDHLITTSIEHSAVLAAADRLAHDGIETTKVDPLPNGLIDPMDILRAIRPETRLISVMLANNETGVVQPVEEIGRIAAQTGVWFHIDAVQGAGKIPIDVKKIGCHVLTISGHKMYAPKGIGAMYVRKGTPLDPLLVSVEATSAAAAPAPRMFPPSSPWARRPRSPCMDLSPAQCTVSPPCATASRAAFWLESREPASMAQTPTARLLHAPPTLRISGSTNSKARRW